MDTLPRKPSPTNLAREIGISVPYASQLLRGHRVPPMDVAISVYRAIGVKLGPITDASDAEIAILERYQGRAA